MLDDRDEGQQNVTAEETPQADAAEVVEAKAAPNGQSGDGPDDFTRAFRPLTEGDIIKGTVVHIDREGVLVDVGTKSGGTLARRVSRGGGHCLHRRYH